MSPVGEIKLNGELPQLLKIILLVVDRVAFPTLAFLTMFYMANGTMVKVTKVLEEVRLTMVESKTSRLEFQTEVKNDHDCFRKDLEVIKTYSYGYQDYIHGRRPEK